MEKIIPKPNKTQQKKFTNSKNVILIYLERQLHIAVLYLLIRCPTIRYLSKFGIVLALTFRVHMVK